MDISEATRIVLDESVQKFPTNVSGEKWKEAKKIIEEVMHLVVTEKFLERCEYWKGDCAWH